METLVVPPTFFDVVESYNTRMRPESPYGKPDKNRAVKQWRLMIKTLVVNLRADFPNALWPVPGLYDMVFACDPGLWIDNAFIAANFWASQRRLETAHFILWFRHHGFKVMEIPHDALFEGGDCVVAEKEKTVIIGYGGVRTNEAGVEEVKRILEPQGIKVVAIRRVTEEFYHLNSALSYYGCAEPNRLIMFYPEAFESGAYEILSRNLPGVDIISLGKQLLFRAHPDFGGERLYSYALNAIANNKKVLQPYCHEMQKVLLGSSRYNLEVIVPEGGSSEFERSGGSYRCMLMQHYKINT